jgi:hypothetical protein
MPPIDVTSKVENLQQLEVGVAGPGAATRMFLVSGAAKIALQTTGAGDFETKQSYTVLAGPTLSSAEFVKALATASPAEISMGMGDPPFLAATWGVDFVDADFDDESGRTQLRIDVTLYPRGAGTYLGMQRIAFQVTILATAPLA